MIRLQSSPRPCIILDQEWNMVDTSVLDKALLYIKNIILCAIYELGFFMNDKKLISTLESGIVL